MSELQELCEAMIEQRLTDEQHARLQELLRTSDEARRFYARYLHLHATLQWSGVGDSLPLAGSRIPPAESAIPQARSRARLRAVVLLALAASLLLGVWIFLRPSDPSIATLESAKSCKWDEGTLPTQVGASLTPGRLRLAEGLAKITFRSGAEVTLEAPADLELVSARACVLHAGRLIARVPPPAIGFIVETPTAKLEDLGTEFGVHVRDAHTADVEVFSGIVDAKHHGTGKLERMLTGKSLRFSPDSVRAFDPNTEKPPGREQSGEVISISTASGRGKDGYVQSGSDFRNSSDILLLVKNCALVGKSAEYLRKGYVGLDLSPLAGRRIRGAELTFTFTPTGMGFASEVPDATFAVYGLTDETLDGWEEKSLRWQNAPANAEGNTLDMNKLTSLGKFTIAQGEMQGTRTISGEPLVRFLERDTNRFATFVLIRETMGSGRQCMVHGFTGKNHPTLPPTTLRVAVGPGA